MEVESGSDTIAIAYDAKKQSAVSYVVALLTLFLVSGAFYYLFAISLFALYHLFVYRSLWALLTLVTLFISATYPNHILWQNFIDSYPWQTWCEYFSFKVVNKAKGKLDPKQNYIFAEFPHGVFPFGFILSATIVQKEIAPGLHVEGAIASVLFRIPIIRQLAHWFGSRPATTKNINKLLDIGSVGLLPGGIAEIFTTNPRKEVIYLKKRKGFVRIALERGANIVPVYYFGNSQLFDFFGESLQHISRKFRMSALFFYGRFFLPIPYQRPITMVIGDVINVKQINNPSEEQVDELHAEIVAKVKLLFDQHKADYGWENRELTTI